MDKTSAAPAPHIRPLRYLEDLSRRYPQAWSMVEKFKQDRHAGVIEWPAWSHVPSIFWEAVVKQQHGVTQQWLGIEHAELGIDIGRLATLGAWRMTKGIYAFDPTLYQAVIETPLKGDIPAEVLMRLPEWGVYVPTPGLSWGPKPMHGFWACLNSGHKVGPEMFLLPDDEGTDADSHVGLLLALGAGTLSESLDEFLSREASLRKTSGLDQSEDERKATRAVYETLRPSLEAMFSLLLYICATAGELAEARGRPGHPEPLRTKKGLRFFAADGPRTWDVGARLGAALRAAYEKAEEERRAGEGGGVRAHVRRAHWHGYWSGPKAEGAVRNFAVRWMPPIPVNVDDVDALPAVIRKVR